MTMTLRRLLTPVVVVALTPVVWAVALLDDLHLALTDDPWED